MKKVSTYPWHAAYVSAFLETDNTFDTYLMY
jgi:hypothetical protein